MKRSILLTTAAVMALAAGCSKQPAPTPPAPDVMNDCLIDPWTAVDASPYLLPAPAGYSSVTAVNGGSSATRDMYRSGEPEYDGPRLLPPVYFED
ncbi:MAG: hypothetical protein J5533_07345 [Bacteroidales bacterium]|nr:hypothetical protein [Bacteroidales bacterium]